MVDPEHVLHVEDSDADAQLVAHLLAPYSYRISRVRTYGELMDFKETPDVVLLDLRIPGSNSPLRLVADVVRRFRSAGVILLTGISDREGEELSVKAMAAGAQIRLIKHSFDGRRLWLSIREAYQQRQHMMRIIEESRSDMRVEPKALRDTIRGVLDQDLYRRLQEIEDNSDKRLKAVQDAANLAVRKLRKLGAEDTAPIEITFDGQKVDLLGFYRRHEKWIWRILLGVVGAYFATSDFLTGVHKAVMETRERVEVIEKRLEEFSRDR